MAFAIPQLRAIERRISFSFTIPIGERSNRKSHVIMWNLYARRIKVDEPIISLVLKRICRLTKSMRKVQRKTLVAHPTKEVSVMAWIEDANRNILLVRQAAGLKLWTLPGGKVKRGESLVKALKREVYEETGLRVQIDSLLGVLDRRDKDAITLLFAALPDKQSIKLRRPDKEIQRAVFQPALPKRASPSAKYFWSARRGAVKKPPKIRASTHQFPSTPAFAQSSS